eukprot:1159040-Pelagomonas_calceolata.AAC.7
MDDYELLKEHRSITCNTAEEEVEAEKREEQSHLLRLLCLSTPRALASMPPPAYTAVAEEQACQESFCTFAMQHVLNCNQGGAIRGLQAPPSAWTDTTFYHPLTHAQGSQALREQGPGATVQQVWRGARYHLLEGGCARARRGLC